MGELVSALQSAGIVTSFMLAAYTALSQTRARRVTNYLEVIKGHREVWKLQWENPALSEILKPDARARALTPQEHRFLNFLFLHVTCTFELRRTSNLITIEEVQRDLAELLSLPLPRKFWEENKQYYNRRFVEFVDNTAPLKPVKCRLTLDVCRCYDPQE